MYVLREIVLLILEWLSKRPALRNVAAGTAAVATVFMLMGLVRWLLSDAPTRFAVSGKVLLAGEPLDAGTIEFRSIGAGTQAVGGAAVRAGRYQIPRERGLVASGYEVRIFSAAAPPPPTASDPPGRGLPPGVERIPPEFGSQTRQRVEVGRGARNVFDFDIPGGSAAPAAAGSGGRKP
jgi:hypothetical protein